MKTRMRIDPTRFGDCIDEFIVAKSRIIIRSNELPLKEEGKEVGKEGKKENPRVPTCRKSQQYEVPTRRKHEQSSGYLMQWVEQSFQVSRYLSRFERSSRVSCCCLGDERFASTTSHGGI